VKHSGFTAFSSMEKAGRVFRLFYFPHRPGVIRPVLCLSRRSRTPEMSAGLKKCRKTGYRPGNHPNIINHQAFFDVFVPFVMDQGSKNPDSELYDSLFFCL